MKAYELLKTRGRKKSAFISEAIAYYLEHHDVEPAPIPEVKDKALLKQMIMEVLKELNISSISETSDAAVKKPKEKKPSDAKPTKKTTAKTAEPPAEPDVPADDVNLDDVMDMLMGLDAFNF